MNLEKEREFFEAWAKEHTKWDLYWSENINQYMDHTTNAAWLSWLASASRDGYKLVHESEINEAISAIKRSANIFYDNFSDWNEKEYLNSLANRLDKAMLGAVE